MSSLTRRSLLTGGFLATGAAFGAALAAAGRRYGLVPPDSGGIYGPGETLAYAAHRMLGRYEQHHHSVEFVPGTHLAALFAGQAGGTTNSIHHQGIKDLAPGFVVEATCPEDGMVEAIRGPGPGYLAGVQWHPEFHLPDDPVTLDDSVILRDFLAAARAARATRNAATASTAAATNKARGRV